MRILRTIIAPFWKIWFVLWFAIPFLLLFPLFYIGMVNRKAGFVYKIKRVWSRIIALGSFLYPLIYYKTKKYTLPHPCVVVSNHTSYLDIVFSTYYIKNTAIHMGKYELLKIPLFRYFFIFQDIAVNRRSATDAHKAFKEAGGKIDKGYTMVIYPEGTISSGGKLRPFKNGAFKLAIEKQVPIVPVVNLNNWHYLQNGGFLKSNGSPGMPEIIVGEPIITIGMTEKNVPAIKEKVTTFMLEELERFNGKHRYKNG